MPRLELNDSLYDIVSKMGDGNPGAMDAVMQIMVYPGFFQVEGLMYLVNCDEMDIRGTHLYYLWNDSCDRDPKQFELVMRNKQMGHISAETIREATDPNKVTRAKPFVGLRSLEELFPKHFASK